MAPIHLRRAAAAATAVLLFSTATAALAAEDSAPSAVAPASASSSAPEPAATPAPSAGAGKAESKAEPKAEPKAEAEAPQAEVPAPDAQEAVPDADAAPAAAAAEAAVGPEAAGTPDVAADAGGDTVATQEVDVPAGLDDGRLFPSMSNTPDGKVVLYGGAPDPGDSTSPRGDTWKFEDGVWTPVCGTTVPGFDAPCPPGVVAGGALGTSPGGVVLFGGHPGGYFSPTGPSTSETWQFDGTQWHQVCADATCGPQARSFAAIAGNAATTLMFGGLAGAFDTALEDTWAFDGATWTQLCGISMGVPCGPSARFWSSMSWDGTHFVLFGGMEGSLATGSDAVGDTWIWTGSGWQLVCDGVATPCGPAPRGLAAFPTIYSPDPARAGSFLAGGLDLAFGAEGVNTAFRDLWFWSARDMTWRQLQSPWGPDISWVGNGAPPVDGLPLAFAGAANDDCQVVFFGTVLGDGGNGASVGTSNTTTIAGWDNGAGRPATCAEQRVVARSAHMEVESDLLGGLPLTGGGPQSMLVLAGLMALAGFALVLLGRRRSAPATAG